MCGHHAVLSRLFARAAGSATVLLPSNTPLPFIGVCTCDPGHNPYYNTAEWLLVAVLLLLLHWAQVWFQLGNTLFPGGHAPISSQVLAADEGLAQEAAVWRAANPATA